MNRPQLRDEITNSIGMKLVLIPNGTFMMGSPTSEEKRFSDEFQHEVTIGNDYYLGVHEVTQAQYEKVMGENPSYFQGDTLAEHATQTGGVVRAVDSSNNPIESVSWEDAVVFCRRLSELPEEKNLGRLYRLPTESEWEYACRAGTTTAFSFGESSKSLGDYAWYDGNSDGQTHPVGEKKPNAWGLYDMQGNVWEWCAEWHGDYPKNAVTDPVGAKKGTYRVLRGGCWGSVAAHCRSAFRDGGYPLLRNYGLNGFRVALSSPEIPGAPDATRT